MNLKHISFGRSLGRAEGRAVGVRSRDYQIFSDG